MVSATSWVTAASSNQVHRRFENERQTEETMPSAGRLRRRNVGVRRKTGGGTDSRLSCSNKRELIDNADEMARNECMMLKLRSSMQTGRSRHGEQR